MQETLARTGLASLGRSRHAVFSATLAMTGIALVCTMASTWAASQATPTALKSFAWTVFHSHKDGVDTTLSAGLNSVVAESRARYQPDAGVLPFDCSDSADDCDLAIITTKTVAFEDKDCPDSDWCESCAASEGETWMASMSGVVAMMLSAFTQYRRSNADRADTKLAGLVSSLTAFASLLVALLNFSRNCSEHIPDTLGETPLSFIAAHGPGWHLMLLSCVINALVAVAHVLTPVLRSVGYPSLADQLLGAADACECENLWSTLGTRKFAPQGQLRAGSSRQPRLRRAQPINMSAEAAEGAITGVVPDMNKRRLMNGVLLGSAAATVGALGGPFLYFFYPSGLGGGGGGLIAQDALGNVVTFESWTKSRKPGDRALVQGLKGDPYYLITTPAGEGVNGKGIESFAINAVCTHLGCVVPWNVASNKFMCPCHGSQYDQNGKVVRGPAPLSLAIGHVNDVEGKVELTNWSETDFRTGTAPWWKG